MSETTLSLCRLESETDQLGAFEITQNASSSGMVWLYGEEVRF